MLCGQLAILDCEQWNKMTNNTGHYNNFELIFPVITMKLWSLQTIFSQFMKPVLGFTFM